MLQEKINHTITLARHTSNTPINCHMRICKLDEKKFTDPNLEAKLTFTNHIKAKGQQIKALMSPFSVSSIKIQLSRYNTDQQYVIHKSLMTG